MQACTRIIRIILTIAASGILSFSRAAERPNVVFVMTDDQGYGDLSCHGNPVLKTPNLDRLHDESIRLTDYHVSPTCAPTRGALMSGHFADRAGPWHTIMGRSMLYEGEQTFGTVFSANGYATGMFGKWHLGDNYPFRPEDRGFQEVVRIGGGGDGQTPDYWNNAYFDDTYWHNAKTEQYQGYCTDVFFREAKRFIEQSVAAGKPFMAYIASNAPHGPLLCPDKYWKPYEKQVQNMQAAVFFGMIANIDENVGALRAWLKEKHLDQNTIFVFTTDNGTATGAQVYNAGMRGHKGSEYDGGHRVPLFLHWPKGGFTEGRDENHLTAHIDILPTLIDLCGLRPPAHYEFDGRSLVPLLRDPTAHWPDRTIVTDSQRVRDPIKWRHCSAMTQRWRLINGEELYDIKADPGQENNVAVQFPEVAKQLRADYEAWWADISPVFKYYTRIILGNPAENPTRLTCHDWLTDQNLTPWNQAAIRSASPGIGEWALKVEKAGKYRIALRRWPREVDATMCSNIPKGEPVQGMTTFRETPGKGLKIKTAGIQIGSIKQEKPVSESDHEVIFDTELQKGEMNLLGYFVLENGTKLGSYYAYVEKL